MKNSFKKRGRYSHETKCNRSYGKADGHVIGLAYAREVLTV